MALAQTQHRALIECSLAKFRSPSTGPLYLFSNCNQIHLSNWLFLVYSPLNRLLFVDSLLFIVIWPHLWFRVVEIFIFWNWMNIIFWAFVGFNFKIPWLGIPKTGIRQDWRMFKLRELRLWTVDLLQPLLYFYLASPIQLLGYFWDKMVCWCKTMSQEWELKKSEWDRSLTRSVFYLTKTSVNESELQAQNSSVSHQC